MKPTNFFIKDIKEFQSANNNLKNIFNTNKELPHQVFNQRCDYYLFEEFYWGMCEEFWPTVQYLTKIFSEKEVTVAVLDPHPTSYFYKEFGYFNYLKLPTSLSSEEYRNVLEIGPEDYPADAPYYHSEKIVWFSSSKKWAIWGERSLDICVIGFNEAVLLDHLMKSPSKWSYLNEAVEDLIGLNFRNMTLPQDFKDSLSKNYAHDTDSE
ncbi:MULTISPECIES: hypothetical protein [Priestia]|uniref:hypothetical protein n=1 Tax=Priestia TaxID=2800373 RepID=UPI0005ECB880|nr:MULTISPECIES: hypothetical protein [Priestia]KJL03768.1 hypothetical protein N178_16410 [Priestia aryabhattai B8W22]MBX4159959.1 hypothetical protein [Priestia megaterium]MED3895374.1 hypothetical protein [Priestia aryabhattai]